ncbi:hypothetical protein SeMB42_g05238 [Synchytrium endobioticum]|uniref:Uncharacterized protein n=1 Tax=Synchytrium endobioticum TaxID=286115 RepID=A0A507CUE6_9FUNG|nr:hypothetical protein SeMB42_g05238 [Synchytrium endobioticum]TPX42756.1 hypothetical protein SeLEV6574_g05428 [Synchytrium endobioticum]
MRFTCSAGNKVLLVGNPAATAADIRAARGRLSDLVTVNGQVAFEQLDRIPTLQLARSNYNEVYSGAISPSYFPHADPILSKFASALQPNGLLHVAQPILDNSASWALAPEGLVTESALLSSLKLAGLIEPTIEHRWSAPLSDDELRRVFDSWGLKRDEREGHIKVLRGAVFMIEVVAKKPAYEVGAVAKLSFGKKKGTSDSGSSKSVVADSIIPQEPSVETTKPKAAVWTVSVDDEEDQVDGDEDLMNDDELLDEEDLKLPSIRRDGCDVVGGAKRKACKDCTCGLADELEAEELVETAATEEQVIFVRPVTKKAAKSSCGNCYLGDAFRCGSCPYLGMPAFAPGEKVMLGGSMLKDDVEV